MRRGPTRAFAQLIRPSILALTFSILFVLTLISSSAVQAQTFRVIHTFTGAGDGANPAAGLTLGQGGSLYGTAYFGGHDRGNCASTGCGTVYKMSPHNSVWIFTRLYPFTGTGDGANPNSRVTFSPDGTLYGSTYTGNNIYNLKPPPTASPATFTSWKISLVHQFGSVGDGNSPSGSLTFGAASTIYGTTYSGGNWDLCGGAGCGRVYELTRVQRQLDGSSALRFHGPSRWRISNRRSYLRPLRQLLRNYFTGRSISIRSGFRVDQLERMAREHSLWIPRRKRRGISSGRP